MARPTSNRDLRKSAPSSIRPRATNGSRTRAQRRPQTQRATVRRQDTLDELREGRLALLDIQNQLDGLLKSLRSEGGTIARDTPEKIAEATARAHRAMGALDSLRSPSA